MLASASICQRILTCPRHESSSYQMALAIGYCRITITASSQAHVGAAHLSNWLCNKNLARQSRQHEAAMRISVWKGGMRRVSPVRLTPMIERSRHGCAAAKDTSSSLSSTKGIAAGVEAGISQSTVGTLCPKTRGLSPQQRWE